MKRLRKIYFELSEIAEQEATKLWRLARRCEKHGVSVETVNAIREEGWYCHSTLTAYPDRMLLNNISYQFKYAFKF